MHKSLLGLLAAASIAARDRCSLPTSSRCPLPRLRRRQPACIGGLAAGAIIGSAIANSAPPPPRAVYVEPDEYGRPGVPHRAPSRLDRGLWLALAPLQRLRLNANAFYGRRA